MSLSNYLPQNLNRSRDLNTSLSGLINHACANTRQDQSELPGFAQVKHMIGAPKRNKIARYRTDGRLFATDVSAKFKVTWHKLRQHQKSGPIKFRYCALVKNQRSVASSRCKWQRAFENVRISNFEGLVTLTLNRVILHTVVHQSSTATYMPNFIETEETFCGWTDVRTDRHVRDHANLRICHSKDMH